MRPKSNYEKFIVDDFCYIKEEFSKNGFAVKDASDFATYKGWMDKGRKVVRGNKGLKLESRKSYPKPFFYGDGEPRLDGKGRRFYRYCKKSFVLFHKEQTECINA